MTTLTNKQLFIQAHAMTKQVIKSGDNYQVTFGLCLKAIKAQLKQAVVNNTQFLMLAFIVDVLVNVSKKLDIENTYAFIACIMGLLLGTAILLTMHLVNVFTLFFTGSFLL